MRKRLIIISITSVLIMGIIVVVSEYNRFVSDTIFEESSAHLREIYHQANQSLNTLVGRNWGTMRMWVPYLEEAKDDKQIDLYIKDAQKESGFTDFYFVSHEGNYMTLDGNTGYLDLKDNLPKLILQGKNIVIPSVIPGKSEIMVFAIPIKPGTYKDFNYEVIAISFNNGDLVESLKISAFEGQSSSYVTHADGRVIVDNNTGQIRSIHNFIATIEKYSNFTDLEIQALKDDFTQGNAGVTSFSMDNEEFYLVYESAGFEDWMVLGIVPTSLVNANMTTLQSRSALLVTVIAILLGGMMLVFIYQRYRSSLTKKDMEILYREELFSTLSNNVDDVFLMLDAYNFDVDYVSPNIEKLVGIAEEDIRKDFRKLDQLVKDENTILILDHLFEIKPGEQKEWEREYVHQKTGEIRWFYVVVLCRNIQNKKKYILVLSDRTKNKKINQDLEDAVRVAQSANRAKSTFLSNMSHDIRTPMNAIIGFATLAVTDIENTDKVKGYLAKILSAGNHLLSLINDVLDMSRIESGKIQLEEKEANLSDILHDLKTIISGQIHAKQLELYMDTLDVTDEDVFCDKTRMNQVLLNLLSNAIKFTPPGGMVSVRVVQIHNAPEGKGVYEIRVKDTGIGMTEDFVARIFDPFERERTSTVSKIQGTGLGMAITKNIVDMMGGTIEVHTELGKGTEFIIRVTLRLQSIRRNDERIKELEGLRALVVDDDFNTCDSVTKMLTQVGMRSEWTLSGKEAVLRAKQSCEMNDAFNAYIIDWRLPDMNGIEVARQIRRLSDNIPIIVLTAYDWSDIEEEAKAAGVTAFCSKPMFMSDLRESLLSALGQRKAKENHILATNTPEEFDGKRILLVEDNELNQEIASELLQKCGFLIETAENGAVAVEMVENSSDGYYDLILMDVQMPVMNGYEATRKIRSLENPFLANISIVAMTANAFDEDKNEAIENGMNGFISKPIDISQMIETLQSILRNKV